MSPKADSRTVEWPTVFLWIACWCIWLVCLFLLPSLSIGLAGAVLVIVLVLQSSLSHEALHGHPFRSRMANEALAMISLGLLIPYIRFRDTHLAHHVDDRLTDPYDDPETNFCDPVVWAKLGRLQRVILKANNTLAGRMLIGPAVAQVMFMRSDWREICCGNRSVKVAWMVHIVGCGFVLVVVSASAMPIWVYILSCYIAISILKIRTFLEHRAHADPLARTVIIDDGGPLAFLFLNNNLHAVHHMHPQVAWYDLPPLYRENAQSYDAFNDGYNFMSYADVFKRYFVRAKDPVPHPLWPSKE